MCLSPLIFSIAACVLCINRSQCIHSPVDGHLDYLQLVLLWIKLLGTFSYMFFGGYKHSFLLHSFLEMELLSHGITESLIFPLKPIFLEFPHIHKRHHHPPNCANPNLSAISPSTPSLSTHLWVPSTPKCSLNLLLCIATTNLLLNSSYKGLQKWPPKCLQDSTFVLLNSSLHSNQGFRNVNRIISFACFKTSFKFPVKSKLRSWLSKSYFSSGHYQLWNFLSCARCFSILWTSFLSNQSHSQGTSCCLQPRLFPWSLHHWLLLFTQISSQKSPRVWGLLWTPNLV